MVFQKIIYHYSSLLRGASGLAPDLVASTNDMAMEGWTHNNNTCAQLDLVPGNNGIHPKS